MSTTLRHFLDLIQPHLDKDITELAINRPGEVWLEENGKWVLYQEDKIDELWLDGLVRTVAAKQKQEVNETKPLLSTTLSSGLRIQIVMPPACIIGTFTVTIRKPGSRKPSWEYYRNTGFFERVVPEYQGISEIDARILKLKNSGDYEEMLKEAIAAKKNIIISGATSTGKTTFTNLLLDTISINERLITIEDAEELQLSHKNVVRLIYSKGGQGVAKVTPGELLEACLRLTPDRIIYAEIRGPEAFDFLDTIFSGHDGCITSMHASSPMKAIQRLQIMVKKHETGRTFEARDIRTMIFSQVDMIVQLQKEPVSEQEATQGFSTRFISDVYFDPVRQQKYIQDGMHDDSGFSFITDILLGIRNALQAMSEVINKIASKFLNKAE